MLECNRVSKVDDESIVGKMWRALEYTECHRATMGVCEVYIRDCQRI